MVNLHLIKIGLYARVSSVKQAQEKTIDSQVANIIDYANSVGEQIDSDLYFLDDGISGAYLERPGLDRLRDKAISGEISKVYVLSPDRLARKSAHQILLIEEMERLGVCFSFVNRQIGETPEDQLLLQIQGIVSEYEREKILERSRRGKLYAAKSGKISVLAGSPYGYYYKKSTEQQNAIYEVHREEALVVKEAFKLYCENNYSLNKIALHFKEQGYRTRKNKQHWDRSVIWGMLRNPAYMGKAAFRKTKRIHPDKKTKAALDNPGSRNRRPLSSARIRPQEEWIYINVPALVDEKQFQLAQEKFKKNAKLAPRNNKKYYYLLRGLLRCKTCGYSLYGKSVEKGKRLYYRCIGQDNNRFSSGRVCSGHPIRTEVLEEIVWHSVKELLLNPEVILNEYEQRLRMHTSNNDGSIIHEKQKEMQRYQQERVRLIDLFQMGLVDKIEIDSKLKNVRAKVDQLKGEINYLNTQEENSKKVLTVIDSLSTFAKGITDSLDKQTLEEKRDIVKLLIEEIEVDTIHHEIKLKHIIPLKHEKCQLRLGSY